jgi:hypothetical protein
MKKESKQEKPAPLQEELVEDKHPSQMTEAEFERYWAWFNAELPPLPKEKDQVDE